MGYSYMKKLKIVELFSGIGSQARALENVGIKIDVQATCEWDIHAFIAYDAMHKGTNILDEVAKMTKEEVYDKLKDSVKAKEYNVLDYLEKGYNYIPYGEVYSVDSRTVSDCVKQYFE